MFVQCCSDHVRVFPAVDPSRVWRFSGMRAFGGFVLAVEFGGGQSRSLTVHSLLGGRIHLRSLWDAVTVQPEVALLRSTLKDGRDVIEFQTRPGITCRLARSGGPVLPPPVIE
jgi:hypothetical protein